MRDLAYAILIVLIAPPVVNIAVDPTGVYGVVDVQGINHAKTAVLWEGGRRRKSMRMQRGEHGVLILGSSRAELGLSPASPAFDGRRVYNASLRGTNMYELSHAFEYARAHMDLQAVVFELSFVNFSARTTASADYEDSGFAGRSALAMHLGHVYAPGTLRMSARTVVHNLRGLRAGLREDGFMDGGRIYPIPPNHRRLFDRTLSEDYFILPRAYAGFVYSPERVDLFRHVVDACRADGIALYAFIPPVHARQLEAIQAMGLTPVFEQWKRDLTAAVQAPGPDTGAAAPVTLWDFSGYSDITTEPVPAADQPEIVMQWYWDSSHYKPVVGDLILARLFGKPAVNGRDVPADFGGQLAPDNIEAHLRDLQADHARWAGAFPDEVAEVARLARESADRRRAALAAAPPLADSL